MSFHVLVSFFSLLDDACLALGSRFAFACSKLEFVNSGNLAFKLHKFVFNLSKVDFDCVDLGRNVLVMYHPNRRNREQNEWFKYTLNIGHGRRHGHIYERIK